MTGIRKVSFANCGVISGQRCQTIHALSIGEADTHLEGEKCTFSMHIGTRRAEGGGGGMKRMLF